MSASTATAGNFGFTATRYHAGIFQPLANSRYKEDWASLGLPEIANESCLFPIQIAGTTTTGTSGTVFDIFGLLDPPITTTDVSGSSVFSFILSATPKFRPYPLAGTSQAYPAISASTYPITAPQSYPALGSVTYPLEGEAQDYPLAGVA